MRSLRLIAAAGALGIAASTTAAAAWSPPQRASAGAGDAHSPDVAVNGAGAGIAAWVQEAGTRGRIVAGTRRAGGGWSRPAAVSRPGLSAVDPRVAIDPAGRVVVLWRQVVRTRVLQGRQQAVYVTRARERRPGSGWGTVATLSDDRQKVGTPELAIDGRGVAVATWHWGTGTRAGTPGHAGQIQVAERRPGRAWSPARRVSRPAGCALDTRLPDVALSPAGHAVVWWQCDLAGGRSDANAIARGRSPAAWSAERRLPFETHGDQVADLAVAPDGTILALSASIGGALAAWRGAAPLGADRGLSLGPVLLPSAQTVARDGGRLAIAADATGAAVGGWVLGCRAGPCGGLGVADLAAGGRAERVTELAGPVRARRGVRVAGAPNGRAVAVAVSGQGIVAAIRPPRGEWAAPERISATEPIDGATGARLGVDAAGGAVAYWSRRAGGRLVVERATLAAAP